VTQSWIKTHERLLCLALVLLFGGFGVQKYYDHEAQVTASKADIAAQVSAADKANALALASQSAQIAAQYASLVQALSAENAALNASIVQRQAAQKTQINVDTNLPLSGVAARWNILVPTVTPTVAPGRLLLTGQEAHDSLAYMEQMPTLQANLADETKLAINYQAEVQKSDMLTTDLNSQITGLQKQNSDQVAQCKTEVAAVRAQGRKNSIKWFKRGAFVGFLAGLWAGHSMGL
jgi:multidrug efflux pump subunit AcrA (membrane-fusion protein)